MRCAECGWKYPESFLHELFISGNYTEPVCGICALEMSNKMIGINRIMFKGEMAESIRQAAIRWRRNHPADKPTTN